MRSSIIMLLISMVTYSHPSFSLGFFKDISGRFNNLRNNTPKPRNETTVASADIIEIKQILRGVLWGVTYKNGRTETYEISPPLNNPNPVIIHHEFGKITPSSRNRIYYFKANKHSYRSSGTQYYSSNSDGDYIVSRTPWRTVYASGTCYGIGCN